MIFCTSQKCGPLEIVGPGAAAPLAPPLMRAWFSREIIFEESNLCDHDT